MGIRTCLRSLSSISKASDSSCFSLLHLGVAILLRSIEFSRYDFYSTPSNIGKQEHTNKETNKRTGKNKHGQASDPSQVGTIRLGGGLLSRLSLLRPSKV